MNLKEKLTPSRLINIGIAVLFFACFAMSLCVTKSISKASINVMGRVDSIITVLHAESAIRFYGDASQTPPTKEYVQGLLSSQANLLLKDQASLMINKDLLAKVERAEKSITSGSGDNKADVIEWLTKLQTNALSDILKRDLEIEYTIAPALAATNGYFMMTVFALMIACGLIGFGYGWHNRIGIPCDLRTWYKFRKLSLEWKKATKTLSDWTLVSNHPAYLEIIDMGFDVVPHILSDLKFEGGHWFAALEDLTGTNPVAEEDAGNVKKMTEAWLAWGASKRLIND